jgi:hypothetical protein
MRPTVTYRADESLVSERMGRVFDWQTVARLTISSCGEMGADAWVASPLPSILEWRAWTADQTIAITAGAPTTAAIMSLRIRHLLADGTRIAWAYGWQPQCEAFHRAEIKCARGEHLPPRVRDPHPRDLDLARACDDAVGGRRSEPGDVPSGTTSAAMVPSNA